MCAVNAVHDDLVHDECMMSALMIELIRQFRHDSSLALNL